MRLFFHSKFIYFLLVFGYTNVCYPTISNAIPLGDAYETGQAEFQSSSGFHPRNETPPVFHPSMHPNLNDKINEVHPIPDYIKKFAEGQAFPIYYKQLLEVDPKDQVQSKVFNEQAFRSTRRIGIFSFENKTSGLFKDDNAGNVLAKQVAQELQSVNKYFIFQPSLADEDAQLTIIKQLPVKTNKLGSPDVKGQLAIPGLSHLNNKTDAVIIGAVTKYMDSYQTRNGNIEKSLSSSIEFGAFLVSTLTGDVIWGARFIGSQPKGLSRFLLNSGPTWLSKEELSQVAMKNVLKAFHENQTK